MPIFRVNKTKNFTIVNNHILRNKDASLKAKGLLTWMLSCDDDWNFSLEGMKQCLKEGDDAIRSGLSELEDLGYLQRLKLMPESYTNERGERIVVRSQIEYIYDIFEQPQEQTVLHTENQYVESQYIENPVQRNTKDKEELNIRKAPEPVLSTSQSSINNPRRNFRKEHEKLEDVLESGKYIDEEQKKKKKSPAEKLRDSGLAEIDKRSYGAETREILKEYFLWASSGTDVRRIRNIDLWKSKLDALEQIAKKSSSNMYDIVKQSLDNKWYKFEELSKVKSDNNQYEPLADSVIMTDRETAKKEWEKKLESDEGWY